MNFQNERILALVKPDGVQRGLIGEVIKRYERTGLKLIALKMVLATEDLVEKHYLIEPGWKRKTGEKNIKAYRDKGLEPPILDPEAAGERVLQNLKKYLTCGPVVAMIWQGMNALAVIRKITGGTEPFASDGGTIRGDFTIDSYTASDTGKRAVRNLVHTSSDLDTAQKEINLWFKPEELIEYRLVGETILYDVNLDGTPE